MPMNGKTRRANGIFWSVNRRGIASVAGCPMTFVVTENCIKCKYTDCVEVCPVGCFHEGPNMLVINPDECIDCTLCVPVCPSEAIRAEEDVGVAQLEFIELNKELSKNWPVINTKKDPLPDADEWKNEEGKPALLER